MVSIEPVRRKSVNRPRSAIVVGGGPAGLSAAIGLLRLQIPTIVLDQRVKWLGRVCGSFMNPESVSHLQWLGVWDQCLTYDPPSVHSSKITHRNKIMSEARLVQDETPAIALPRKKLEEILHSQLRQEGGEFQTGARVLSVKQENNNWITRISTGAEFQSDILIMADGRFSMNTRAPENTAPPTKGWYGWNATFRGTDQTPGDMSLHLFSRGYVGVLTFSDGTTNVCGPVHLNENHSKDWNEVFRTALKENTVLKTQLSKGEQQSDWQGVGPLPFCQTIRKSQGAFLVGDAAAVGDPFMGEGIGRALGAGPMLHQALQTEEPLITYTALWQKAYERRLHMSHWLRKSLIRPLVLPLASQLLYRNPWFIKFAARRFHVGYNAPSKFALKVSVP